MHHTTALLTLYSIICIANAKVYPIDTISCNSNGDSESNCKFWYNRLKELHIYAVECRDVENYDGKDMIACSPKWITLNSASKKRIMATYKVYNDILHVTIDYPKISNIEKVLLIMSIVILTTLCVYSINEDCSATGIKNDDLSLCDIAALIYLTGEDDSYPYGGIDYSCKNE